MPIKLPQNKMLDNKKVSNIFHTLEKKPKNDKTTVQELLNMFHENGLLLAMIVFAIPVAIPLPYPPGFTTIMGVPIIILSVQMLLGFKQVSLPQKINQYQINNSILIGISKKALPMLKLIEKYMKVRGGFAKSVYCEQLIGFISLIAAIAIAVPLPLTNAIPALGIAIMALGLLNRDMLVIIVGIITSIVGLLIAVTAIVASMVAIKYLFNLIF